MECTSGVVMVKGIPVEQQSTCKDTEMCKRVWLRSRVWARIGEEKFPEELIQGQTVKGPTHHAKVLGLYPEVAAKPLEKFKQESDMLRSAI